MGELTSTTGTTNNDSSGTDKRCLMPVDEAERDVEEGQNGEGGEVTEAKKGPEEALLLEEALETHEVVEINKFTERKEWIEEKIKLLESIPPIEVFAGVDTLLSLSEEVPPDLPTRAQLNHWLEEHDRTEKETEIFDAEDMSKLKKLTKAATQRNLSPDDTDLIELTLTTLLALDKLLHLLRDRSELLDLLSLRLTWDEQRVASWKERRSLLSDLQVFLRTRARWSLDTYELQLPFTPSPSPALRFTSPSPSPSPRPSSSLARRRDSAASLASISSDTSSSITGPSAVFSRSTRYKLAELLSHDAALFSGRLTSLNHSKVMAAGKTLDKLIDASRKPVPDEILDEQDRLEDKAIKEIETVGKFAMAVVMQWKRADEHYNDTIKDQIAAQTLITELNNAELQHPTTRHNAAFMSRAQALTKRLAVKGDPSLPRSSFPRPVHPLFPDQAASNEIVAKTLSTELSEAVRLARQAETAAQAYHARLEAVTQAALLRDQMLDMEKQLEKIGEKLVRGMHDGSEHGDASPLNLQKEVCLDPMRHATYLALLSSVMQELDRADQAANYILRDSTRASLRLKALPGIDPILNNDIATAMKALETRREAARQIKEDILARVSRLKEARRLWGILLNIMDSVEDVGKQALQGMDSQRWKAAESRRNDTPITPDSDSPHFPQISLPVQLTPHTIPERLDVLRQRLSSEFSPALAHLLPSLETTLSVHLQSSSDGLMKYVDNVHGLVRLWEAILAQADIMTAVQQDACELGHKIDALQNDVDDVRESVLGTDGVQEDTSALESELTSRTLALQQSVRTFTDALVARMTFVSRNANSRMTHTRSHSLSNFPPSSLEHQLKRLKDPPEMTLPFDLSALDNDVRAEGNSLALRLAGGMQSLAKKLDYLHLSRLARIVDSAIEGLSAKLNSLEEELSILKASFESLSLSAPQSMVDTRLSETLASMIEQSDKLGEDHLTLVVPLTSPIEQSLQELQAAPASHDSPIHGTIVLPRMKASDEVLQRTKSIRDIILKLRQLISEVKEKEDSRLRLEKERLEAEERARIEAERLAAEKERLEAEERARIEAERLAAEKERLEAEERVRFEAERLAAEKERLEAEERARIEAERLKAEKEEQLEAEERTRVEAERLKEEKEGKERAKAKAKLLKAEKMQEELRFQVDERAKFGEETLEASAQRTKIEATIRREGSHSESVSVGQGRAAENCEHTYVNAQGLQNREDIGTHSAVQPEIPDEDVFGRRLVPSVPSANSLSSQMIDLRNRIAASRTRLRSLSLSLNSLVRSPYAHNGGANASFPSSKDMLDVRSQFSSLVNDTRALPTSAEDPIVDSELQSLRSEVNAASLLVGRLVHLGEVHDKVAACDHALSDLLEHADTYPAAPQARHLASPHISDARLPCEEQLASRVAFTKTTMDQMNEACVPVMDDPRVIAEQTRLKQTWSELADMCTDRINGTRSRPASSISSSGLSSGAASNSLSRRDPKPSLTRTPVRPRHSESITRRTGSNVHDPISRPSTHMSNRSVSGPSGSSSLFNTTYASRQRTTSLASIQSVISSPFQRPTSPVGRSRKRPGSPTFSELSGQHLMSTPSRSTWSRAPRQSFGTVPRNVPTYDTPIKRKTYVANPRSKLDMAVGQVINNFRLPVTIHAAGDGWKDQSGKYWIGDAEPKLCFCRILRSQTVMVRVGGGWCELSKFLRGHFADLLAELPPSPPRNEERWISAATVREDMASSTTPAKSPTTPEAKGQVFLPSLQLSTPNGTSPQSLKTSSSSGACSPNLTPFQFMRRADAGLRPVTPSPSKSPRTKPATPAGTPSRTTIWRP